MTDLAAQVLAEGGGRFSGSSFAVDARGPHTEVLSKHERLHRILNDITSYGALLDGLARLASDEGPDAAKYAHLVKQLVGRCRTTHETFATFLSSYSLRHPLNIPEFVASNPEYLAYHSYGRHFVDLAPTAALGLTLLNDVAKIAMDGPLPEAAEAADFAGLTVSGFRAADAPDARFTFMMRILTQERVMEICRAARERFSFHPHWERFIEREEGAISTFDFFAPRTVNGMVMLETGGIDAGFETDVSNFIFDRIWLLLQSEGVRTYTQAERRALEARIRERVARKSDRFYDNPDDTDGHHRRRDMGREQLVLQPPHKTVIASLERVGADWGGYQRIAEAEGHMPVTLELKEDFLRNHDVLNPKLLGDLAPGRVVCYMQQQFYLDETEQNIGRRVHLIDDAARLFRLGIMADCRVQVSAKLLVEPAMKDAAEWFEALAGKPLSILLDADPRRVFRALRREWEYLVWHQINVAFSPEQSYLLMYPMGGGDLPEIGFFRPCTSASLDAVLRSLDPPAIPLILKALGGQIAGVSEASKERAWDPPEFLTWAIARYANDAALFVPLTPEEMSHG